jgi:hypothetical protein
LIDRELSQFLESGISILFATCAADRQPEGIRAFGARFSPDGREVTIFVPADLVPSVLPSIAAGRRAAVCFSRPSDNRSVQLKGPVLAVAPATPADRSVVDRYRKAFAKELAWLGLPLSTGLRMAHWPSLAVRLRIEAVYQQTPGPGAGEPLSPATGGAAS